MRSIFFKTGVEQQQFEQKNAAVQYFNYKQEYYQQKQTDFKNGLQFKNDNIKNTLQEYQQLQQKYKNQVKKENIHFETLFEVEDDFNQFEIEQKRQQYFEQYILVQDNETETEIDNQQLQQQAIQQIQNDQQDVEDQISFQEIIRRNRVIYQEKEKNYINNQVEQYKTKEIQVIPKIVCNNSKILEKISPIIYNSYMVYFDELMDMIMDDIFEEEVVYLNSLEQTNQKVEVQIEPQDKQQIPYDLLLVLENLETFVD